MHAKAVNAGKINKKNTNNKKIAIIRQKTKLNPSPQWSRHSVAPDIAAALKNNSLELIIEKEQISGIWFF